MVKLTETAKAEVQELLDSPAMAILVTRILKPELVILRNRVIAEARTEKGAQYEAGVYGGFLRCLDVAYTQAELEKPQYVKDLSL